MVSAKEGWSNIDKIIIKPICNVFIASPVIDSPLFSNSFHILALFSSFYLLYCLVVSMFLSSYLCLVLEVLYYSFFHIFLE